LLFVVRHLVDRPDEVTVEMEERGGTALYRIRVNAEDLGKVVGRGGRLVRAIRQLARACAILESRRAVVEVTAR